MSSLQEEQQHQLEQQQQVQRQQQEQQGQAGIFSWTTMLLSLAGIGPAPSEAAAANEAKRVGEAAAPADRSRESLGEEGEEVEEEEEEGGLEAVGEGVGEGAGGHLALAVEEESWQQQQRMEEDENFHGVSAAEDQHLLRSQQQERNAGGGGGDGGGGHGTTSAAALAAAGSGRRSAFMSQQRQQPRPRHRRGTSMSGPLLRVEFATPPNSGEEGRGGRSNSGNGSTSGEYSLGQEALRAWAESVGWGEMMAAYSMKEDGSRVYSLDILRGLALVGMLVAPTLQELVPLLRPSPWDGLTLADLFLPLFLFVLGVSCALAFFRVPSSASAVNKIYFRFAKIFYLGLLVHGGFFHGAKDTSFGITIENFRYWGILQTVAVAFVFVSWSEIAVMKMFRASRRPSGLRAFAASVFVNWGVALVLVLLYLCLTFLVRVPSWTWLPPSTPLPPKPPAAPGAGAASAWGSEGTSMLRVWGPAQPTSAATRASADAGAAAAAVVGPGRGNGPLLHLASTESPVVVECDSYGRLDPSCNAAGYVDRWLYGASHLMTPPPYASLPECQADLPTPPQPPSPPAAPASASASVSVPARGAAAEAAAEVVAVRAPIRTLLDRPRMDHLPSLSLSVPSVVEDSFTSPSHVPPPDSKPLIAPSPLPPLPPHAQPKPPSVHPPFLPPPSSPPPSPPYLPSTSVPPPSQPPVSPPFPSPGAAAPVWCSTPFDPQGTTSLIGATLTAFAGLHYGHLLAYNMGVVRSSVQGLLFSLLLLGVGWALRLPLGPMLHDLVPTLPLGPILHYQGIPLNPSLFSISFTCLSSGVAALLLCALHMLADTFWLPRVLLAPIGWIGRNPLVVFVFGVCGALEALLRGVYWNNDPRSNLVAEVERILRSAHFFGTTHPHALAACVAAAQVVWWSVLSGTLLFFGVVWKL